MMASSWCQVTIWNSLKFSHSHLNNQLQQLMHGWFSAHFIFQFIQLLTNIPMMLNGMSTAPRGAGFMIKPDIYYILCFFLVFLCFTCVEHPEVNWSAPFSLSSIVCSCYLSFGFRNDVSLFERQCEGFPGGTTGKRLWARDKASRIY